MSSTSVLNPLSAVLSPEDFFGKPLTIRDAVIPFAVAAAAGIFLGRALQPFVEYAVLQSLPADAAARFAADSAALNRVRWVADLGALLLPFLKSAVYAGMAYLVIGATANTLPRFVSLHVCAAWSMLILTAKSIAQFVILAANGSAAISGPEDLSPGTGFGFLAGTGHSLAYDLLELINGFDLAFVAVFALTIQMAARTSLRCASAAAMVPWLLLAAIRIGFNVMLYR